MTFHDISNKSSQMALPLGICENHYNSHNSRKLTNEYMISFLCHGCCGHCCRVVRKCKNSYKLQVMSYVFTIFYFFLSVVGRAFLRIKKVKYMKLIKIMKLNIYISIFLLLVKNTKKGKNT